LSEHLTRDAYQAFAPIYDDFNYRNNYDVWFDALLPELEKRGLRKGRLLDVGCGTGRAFEPMLNRGWEVQGCDLSPAMLEQARGKVGDRVPLSVADARELPVLGEFDLVWALNDVVNYLTGDGDLERALRGFRSNLADGGMVLFDSNSLSLFREDFASGDSEGQSVGEWVWHGMSSEVEAGGTYEARVSGSGVEAHIHRERHYPTQQIEAAMKTAEIEPLAVFGQQEVDGKVVLVEPPDELRDHKLIYIGRAA
jgi:SAM-dependent methyltransferase